MILLRRFVKIHIKYVCLNNFYQILQNIKAFFMKSTSVFNIIFIIEKFKANND